MLQHCNDANCEGDDESVVPFVPVDSATQIFSVESLLLDGAGNPLVAYVVDGGKLQLAHCNDPNCAGNDELVMTVGNDTSGSSVALDVAGNPVVAYVDATDPAGGRLKVVHCNDPDCAGGDESVVTVVNGSADGLDPMGPSMAIDSSGNPVIGYYDNTNDRLALLRCTDPNCVGGGSSAIIDTPAGIPSLELDSDDRPVLSYSRKTDETVALVNTELRLAHCRARDCLDAPTTPTTTATPTPATPTAILPATGSATDRLVRWAIILFAAGVFLTAITVRRRCS